MDLPIPMGVVYAGLVGTLLALVVAAATNRWQLRVFFLLALRLAIGWHFLFEGLHKIHSHSVGPTETSRPFTSEQFFKASPTRFGAQMRKEYDDPAAVIAEYVTPPQSIAPEAFRHLSEHDQAVACPPTVARQFDALIEKAREAGVAAAEADLKAADAAEAKGVAGAKTEADKAAARKKAEAARQEARKRSEEVKNAGAVLSNPAKAKYARWVYGAEGRDAKVKFMTGEAALTAPQRLAHIERLRGELAAAEDRRATGLGNGPHELKRTTELRNDHVAAEADLAKDALAYFAEIARGMTGGKPVEPEVRTGDGKQIDRATMWFITIVGACILFGLFTRLSCVLAAGFLVATYLAHPPFPWYPLPPNTEGNPVFVNKNVIEILALLVIAVHPTGRWLGLDALIARVLGLSDEKARG
jgi:uncharacterized membrane protein YphA (DoxX/SURF4 family)